MDRAAGFLIRRSTTILPRRLLARGNCFDRGLLHWLQTSARHASFFHQYLGASSALALLRDLSRQSLHNFRSRARRRLHFEFVYGTGCNRNQASGTRVFVASFLPVVDSWKLRFDFRSGYGLGPRRFGVAVAFDVLYTAFTVFFYIAVVRRVAESIERRPINLGAICRDHRSALLVAGWVFSFCEEIPQLQKNTAEREHLRSVAGWSLAIPYKPDLHLLSPYPETLQQIRILAEHDALRPRLMASADAGRRSICRAKLKELRLSRSRRLALAQSTARARVRTIPGGVAPADLRNSRLSRRSRSMKLFGVKDGASTPGRRYRLVNSALIGAGFVPIFAVSNSTKRYVIFEARAIDLRRKQVFPLAAQACSRAKN